MAGNTFGKIFSLTTFGESHGKAIGGIIDGCPAGFSIDLQFIQKELSRRKPGQSSLTTARKEEDEVQFLSGIFEGKTTGTPIGFIIQNKDHQSKDYDLFKDVYRPSHADFTYQEKYGIRDFRGGGRSSARETACRVVAGAIAKLLLKNVDVSVQAFVSAVADVSLDKNYNELNLTVAEQNIVRCPDFATAEKMEAAIMKAREAGDSLGGIISCVIKNVPAGLGEPVFDKLHADLGKAMLSINAVKGFEIGSGFKAAAMKGSQHNDSFVSTEGRVGTTTNFSGGIQGGISNGEDIYFNVAFKPVATIQQKQQTVNNEGEEVVLEAKGRHDPCVVPRAVPIVESMAALVIADHLLRNKIAKI
jgi:chorismate synthase